ncbi:uncharacterized protein MONBRDRAFT_30951 [Monosiga brevicollis MX1]|uniref:PID domain-containing protein n=1 Tax=Monosiga brevicollis TaxID=81824 RepID=A9UQD1_MONBE|nr:uncharacterized protein MONBRDRAFT_30951 [Monosiga brevicollis MX1]EDQ92577.1 predicted protein [Monosiga brevicollis MX1]|eukprot:XP_001742339.1 hypothetical protein [Monosiga brevicollis MX1]
MTEYQLTYKGFIYVKQGKGDDSGAVTLDEVRRCAALLNKPKKARDIHPLFARGFATPLKLKLIPDGLRVYVFNEETKQDLVVMDHPLHRIVFVVADDKDVYVVAKHELRGKGTMYKCHGFRCSSDKEAKQTSNAVTRACNECLAKLRATREFVRKNSDKALPIRRRSHARAVANPAGASSSGNITASEFKRYRPTKRRQDDSDADLLKRYIAMARKSVIVDTSEEYVELNSDDEAAVEQTFQHSDVLDDDQVVQMREELKLAVSAISPLDVDEALSDSAAGNGSASSNGDELDFANFEWDGTFDDDFARMTLFVHHGYSADVPPVAEITLDSAIFDLSNSTAV